MIWLLVGAFVLNAIAASANLALFVLTGQPLNAGAALFGSLVALYLAMSSVMATYRDRR